MLCMSICFGDQMEESFYTISWACGVEGNPFVAAGGVKGIIRVINVKDQMVHKVYYYCIFLISFRLTWRIMYMDVLSILLASGSISFSYNLCSHICRPLWAMGIQWMKLRRILWNLNLCFLLARYVSCPFLFFFLCIMSWCSFIVED